MTQPELEQQLTRHHEAAFGWALSCCRWDRSMAEDVLHDSYLKILDGRAAYAGRSEFRTWLFSVIRKTAASQFRRTAIRRFISLGDLDGAVGAGRPASVFTGGETGADGGAAFRRALGKLSSRQRDVLHLVFYQDLTIAQAADVLGVSLGTARTHYTRGKASLRRLLEQEKLS